MLMNATADVLKDLLLGRKTSLEDLAVDNVLRLAGFSKYVIWKARMDGLGSAGARMILPPFKFLDSAYKDLVNSTEKGYETIQSIPFGGKLYYWWMGKGSTKGGSTKKGGLSKSTKALLLNL
jgi:hypothetical protein